MNIRISQKLQNICFARSWKIK